MPYPPVSTAFVPVQSPRHTQISPVTNERTTSSAWSQSEDDILMRARAQGQNWAPIAHDHFPAKSPNACRKRHERLMEKRNNAENWDGVKVEVLAKAYLEIREQMWQLLAEKVNEKWSTVEEKVRIHLMNPGFLDSKTTTAILITYQCMEKGLRTLLNVGRSASKRQPSHQSEEPNDDNGMGPDPPRDSSEPDQPQSQPPAPTNTSENTHHLRSSSGNRYYPPTSSSVFRSGHSVHSSHRGGSMPDSLYRSAPSTGCGPDFNIASSLVSTNTPLPSLSSLPSSSPSLYPTTTTAGSRHGTSTPRSNFEMPSIASLLGHHGSVSTC